MVSSFVMDFSDLILKLGESCLVQGQEIFVVPKDIYSGSGNHPAFYSVCTGCYHECGSVTTAWRVLGLRMEKRPPIWRVAVNKLSKQLTRGGPPAWGLDEVLTTPFRKKQC